jgi:hypothetical protein
VKTPAGAFPSAPFPPRAFPALVAFRPDVAFAATIGLHANRGRCAAHGETVVGW